MAQEKRVRENPAERERAPDKRYATSPQSRAVIDLGERRAKTPDAERSANRFADAASLRLSGSDKPDAPTPSEVELARQQELRGPSPAPHPIPPAFTPAPIPPQSWILRFWPWLVAGGSVTLVVAGAVVQGAG